MTDKNKRKKASDIFRESPHIFEPEPFKQVFPTIEELKIEVLFEGKSIKKWQREDVYTLKNPPGEYIDCKNKFCYGGGFHIGNVLRKMVAIKQTEKKELLFCTGSEGSPKGKRITGTCTHSFNVSIAIKYKDA